MAAPSASDLSLAQAMRGSMVDSVRTKVPKPQSVPAMTFSAHDLGIPHHSLGHELGVLDKIGGGVETSRGSGPCPRRV